MRKGEATRSAIVEEALGQAVALGLEGLSLGGVVRRMPITKSGLYAHFECKEALQLSVLERAAERFLAAVIAPALGVPAGASRVRLLFALYLGWMRDGAGAGGCVFVGAAQEFDDRPGPVRDRLVGILTEWRAVVGQALADAVGEPRADGVEQATFEFLALALAYQQGSRLMGDAQAERRASVGLERLLEAGVRPAGSSEPTASEPHCD